MKFKNDYSKKIVENENATSHNSESKTQLLKLFG